MRRPTCTLAVLLIVCSMASGKDPTRVFGRPDAEPKSENPREDQAKIGPKPADRRLGEPRNLNGYFPMTVPANKQEWERRRRELREQVLVATGLWPLPEKTALHPVIHGKIDRDEYTVEKVFFASYPGHYVSGNLYRPKGKQERVPGVLCPHGHWANGRFYDAGEKAAREQIAQGAEKTMEGARYPLQARCAMLARTGCVVFHYDMVGVADSQPIAHRAGFTDAQADLRLQSFMGLQTWNSIRALDFLLSLPDVDPKRIGVTGASGGGTQTFMLCAVDDRPTVAFPAVMVSTAMQGGCICENCDYLRQGAGNIDLAGLFAPKPLAMSGANDWTIDIETKGLPELKALYKLYNAEDRVMAKCLPQFGHNYNQVSREVMYNWFNKHLQLGQPEPVVEKPFVPVPPQELSVYDEAHPRPADAAGAEELRKYLSAASDRQRKAVAPKDAEHLIAFRRLVATALRVMIHDRLPQRDQVGVKQAGDESVEKARIQRLVLGRKDEGEQIPAVLLTPADHDGTVVLWIHPAGKSSLMKGDALSPEAQTVLQHKAAILAVDVFLTGEYLPARPAAVDKNYAGYTFGYNRPLLANRVHDILTAIAYARGHKGVKAVHLVGFEKAGPWVVLARALCGDAVGRTAADLARFDFQSVQTTGDEMMLPGAVKYGGLPAFAALCAPGELYVYNQLDRSDRSGWTRLAYQTAGAGERLHEESGAATPAAVLEWLLR
jgi:dienelactone hydrolase